MSKSHILGRIERVEEKVEVEPGPRPRIRVKDLDGEITQDDLGGPYFPDILIVPAEGIEARIEEGKMAEALRGKTGAELTAVLADLRRKVAEAEGGVKE